METIKLRIYKEELYPVFYLSSLSGGIYQTSYDLPEDLYRRFQNNMKEFDEIQDELRKIYENVK